MKKVLALILTLLLALSLFACAKVEQPATTGEGSEGETQQTTDAIANETTTEEVPEGGEQLTIGFNTNSIANETMSYMIEVFEQYGKENNIKIITSEDGGDTATMLTNLENFEVAGVDGVIFMNYDPVGAESMVEDMISKGIAVISYDEYSEAANYSFTVSNWDLGYSIGKMGAEWINETLGGSAEICLLASDTIPVMVDRADGIEAGFKENCTGEVIIYREDSNPFDKPSVDVFANTLAAHPNIHVITGCADAAVVPPCEAWYGDLVGAGADISKYAGFSTDCTAAAITLMQASLKNEAVFRGSIDLGLKDAVPLGMITACHAAILGKETDYEKVTYYVSTPVTAKNLEEFLAK